MMIQMGKHDSYDCAPDKLFFKKGKKRVSEASTPGKEPECIEQKRYQLMEKGAITCTAEQ